MPSVTIRLFGVLQPLVHTETLILSIPTSTTPAEVRALLLTELKKMTQQHERLDILNHCVFADDAHIFSETESITNTPTLAVLPPFSGG